MRSGLLSHRVYQVTTRAKALIIQELQTMKPARKALIALTLDKCSSPFLNVLCFLREFRLGVADVALQHLRHGLGKIASNRAKCAMLRLLGLLVEPQ